MGTPGDLEASTAEQTGASGRYWIAHLPDQWYVACPAAKLRARPLATTILDTPLVVFRTASGRAAALLDRCAHRNAPLSLGRVEGERLACRYHGWQFDCEGACRLVPALTGPQEARSRRVPAFPTREQQGFVWIWLAPERPVTREPFNFPHTEDPDYGKFRIDYRVEATLHATLENMLDVPHTAFLHRGLFRGGRTNRITAIVRRSAAGVEAEYVGEPPPSGLAARILGTGAGARHGTGAGARHGTGSGSDAGPAVLTHYDRFLLPSISQVEYRLGTSHFVATSALTPESDFVTRFSTVITYRLPLPRLLLRALFEPVARRILAQDRWILRKQTEIVRRFGGERYASTAVDVLGPEMWRMLKRAQAGEPALDGEEPVEHRVDLLV